MNFTRVFLLLCVLLNASVFWGLRAQSANGGGYDVIVMQDGTIITGKILEVNLFTVKYQRLDMPDGPVMEIPRNTIYAITYRNQVTEYLLPVDSTVFYRETEPIDKSGRFFDNWYTDVDSGRLQVGIGLIRAFSKISNVESLKSAASPPAISVAYFFPFRQSISLGVMVGIASFNYSEDRISEYDQFQVIRDIRENIISVSALAMYRFGLGRLDPYAMAGFTFYSSRAKSDGILRFLNDQRTVAIQNSASGASFGLVVRGGVHYGLSPKTGAYLDFGNGLTLLQFGGTIKLDFK